MKNILDAKLFWNLLIALEVFAVAALSVFLITVVVLVNSVTDALGDFAAAAIKTVG